MLPVVKSSHGERYRYLFSFGPYASTHVLVYGRSLDDALDEAIDWLADNAPGRLCNDEVEEEYGRLIAERECACSGDAEPCDDCVQSSREEAEIDTTCGGNAGDRIHSWEWFVTEDPTREHLLEIQGRRKGSKHGQV